MNQPFIKYKASKGYQSQLVEYAWAFSLNWFQNFSLHFKYFSFFFYLVFLNKLKRIFYQLTSITKFKIHNSFLYIEDNIYQQQERMMESSSQKELPKPPTQSNLLLNTTIAAIISHKKVTFGSYLRMKTSIPYFHPVYLLSPMPNLGHPRNTKSKQRKKKVNLEDKSTKTIINDDDFILNYGSQLYLQEWNELVSVKMQLNIGYEIITPYFQEFLFGQILMEGKYLTKIKDQIILKEDSSFEAIWAIQYEEEGQVRISNIIDHCYLCFDSHSSKLSFNQKPNPSTVFQIKQVTNSNYYILTSTNPRLIKAQSSKSFDDSSYHQSIEVEILPIDNSAVSIHFQLKFAQWILSNYPTLDFVGRLVGELIYYDIPQFNENQTILSEHIQDLFIQYGLLNKICEFLASQISVEISDNDSKNLKTALKMLRLICLNSQKNTKIVTKLIDKLLKFNYFFHHILLFIKNNTYFAYEFQRRGWYESLLERLAFFQTTEEFQYIWQIYELLAEFSRLSITNKYLLMHTFQASEHEKMQMINMSKYSIDPSSFWLRMFPQGVYIFVEMHRNNKFEEIQLNTFLQERNDFQKDLFVRQLKLITSFCSGFNVNALDHYNVLLKSLAPYCYKQNFPTITHPLLRKSILTAIANSYGSGPSTDDCLTHYSIGVVNVESQSKKRKEKHESAEKQIISIYQELKNLFNWVQKKIYLYLEKEQVEEVCRQGDLESNNVLSEIKIIQLCLAVRLITVTKRKEAQFMEYIRKIFQNVNQPKSHIKKGSNVEISMTNEDSSSQSEVPINGIVTFIYRIIKHSPAYQNYLEAIRISRKEQGKLDVFTNLIKKNSKESETFGQANIDKNDYISHVYKQKKSNEDQLQFEEYFQKIKYSALKVLSLIYQNVNEEQLQYSVETLTYLIKYPNQLSNKFLLQCNFKYPMEDSFKNVLLEQWYLASQLPLFDQATTCLRYLYDKNQIYSRAVNHLLLVSNEELLKLNNTLCSPMEQLEKLSQTISNWFLPPILQKYEDNYRILMRCLQTVNAQLKKQTITDRLQLQDYQRLLNNLNIVGICLSIIAHTHLFENALKHPNTMEKIKLIHEELVKMLEFYTYQSLPNSKRVFICLGEYITKSVSLFPLFLQILNRNRQHHDYTKRLSDLNLLLTESMLSNIVHSLPISKYFLENMLNLDDSTFVKIVQKIMVNPKNIETLNSKEKLKQFLLGYEFREFIHKMAFKLLEISHCGSSFLNWYFDHFLKLILMKECKINLHFKSKIIKSFTSQYIFEHSYIACNLFHLLNKKQKNKKSKSHWLCDEEGHVIVVQYILGELLSSVLSPHQNLLLQYIAYYFYDLLPLSVFIKQFLSIVETKEKVMERVEEYSTFMQKFIDTKSQNMKNPKTMRTESDYMGDISASKRFQSTHYGKMDFTLEDLEGLFEKEQFIKKMKRYLETGIIVDENFQPRSIKIISSDIYRLGSAKNMKVKKEQKVQNPPSSQEKKALKKWYKAKLLFNEKMPKHVERGLEKFLEDVEKVELQFSEDSRDKVINSDDLLHKLYRTIMNMNRLKLTQENQIFLLKCALHHLKTFSSHKRSQKNKKPLLSSTKDTKIVKKLSTRQIVRSLIDEAAFKLRDFPNHPVSLCLILSVINACFEIDAAQLDNFIEGLVSILGICRELHCYQKEVMSIYEIDQTLESTLAGRNPLSICLEILNKIDGGSVFSEQCLIELTQQLLKVKWEHPEMKEMTNGLESKVEEYEKDLYEEVVQNLLKRNEYYQAISVL